MHRERAIDIRPSTIDDASIITQFLHELAAHDGHSDECLINETDLIRFGFSEKPLFEVLIVEVDREPVGLALFFMTFSIWNVTPCLFLSDLYVTGQYRGLGIGKMIFSALAKIAVQRGCRILEWQILTQSEAIKFYARMGGKPVGGFQNYRLMDAALTNLAEAKI